METENKTDGKKKKGLVIFLIIVLVAVIAVLGVIIYKLLHKEPEPIDRGTVGDIVTEEEDMGESPTFMTDMNMIWAFPSGERTSTDAIIGNSAQNQHDVYFEVYLDDEEQTLLYSSPILPVGKRLGKLKLDKALPDGEYPATCTFHLLDNEDQNKEVSRISFSVTLVFAKGNET